MDAMILSAGAGLRMRPLTKTTPKPLLKAGGQSLIEHLLCSLRRAGISNAIVNTSYAAEKFLDLLGDGSSHGVRIRYSHEAATPLETGGGVFRALPLIRSDPFLVVNADIWTDFPFETLNVSSDADGCLVLVDNPSHNPDGDFALIDGKVQLRSTRKAAKQLTFSGISLLRKSLFVPARGAVFPLRDVFLDCVKSGRLAGVHHQGAWLDIGTPARLEQLDSMLRKR